jgi:OFA family oxalate/formate antiporter-like MFS transporter
MMLFLGLIYAWSIFRAPLQAMFDWTLTQLSVTFTLSLVVFGLGGIASGKLQRFIEPYAVIRISAVFILAGFLLIFILLNPEEEIRSLIVLYLCYGAMGGFGIGLSYNAILSTMTRRFPNKVGTVSGVLLLGFGIGGFLLGGLVDVLLGYVPDVRYVFLIIGIAIAAILATLSGVMRALPEKDSHLNEGDVKSSVQGEPLSRVVRSPTFWLFETWAIALCTGCLLIVNSAVPIAQYFGAPAMAGLIFTIFNGAGRPIIGALFDMIGRRNTTLVNTVVMLSGSIALAMSMFVHSPVWIFIGFPLLGLCYGGSSSLTSASPNIFYGPKYYPENFSAAVFFQLLPASIIGPLISSKLQETASNDQKYATTFLMLLIMSASMMVLQFALARSAKKEALE